MPIMTLVGNDQHGIRNRIKALQSKLNTDYSSFNFHCYKPTDLQDALAAARTPPLGDILRIVVIEDCQFSNAQQFGETQVELLGNLEQIPQTTTLIFTGGSIDKRLKLSKTLLKQSKLEEFKLLDSWKFSDIKATIQDKCQESGLKLSPKQLDYFVEAIGNNTARAQQQIDKLILYGNSTQISMEELQVLVPCKTESALQLASLLRVGNCSEIGTLLNILLSQGEHPSVITATLITQFKTWLWVKCAISQGMENNQEIARLCNVANPARVYYLRQEVERVKLNHLAQSMILLFDLDLALKQGLKSIGMLPALIEIAQRFSPVL